MSETDASGVVGFEPAASVVPPDSVAPEPVPTDTEAPRVGRGPIGNLDSLPLDQIEDDTTFKLRPEGDVAGLAQALARSGQLLPVDVRLREPGRWQLVTGFRRVAALRLLRRDRVLARLHEDLGDEAALALALADGLARRPVEAAEVDALRTSLRERGWYGPAAQEAIERALGEAPPPPEPEELDVDVFSRDVAERLAMMSADLAALFDVWGDVEAPVREQIRAQLRYGRDLLPFLEEGGPDSAAREE